MVGFLGAVFRERWNDPRSLVTNNPFSWIHDKWLGTELEDQYMRSPHIAELHLVVIVPRHADVDGALSLPPNQVGRLQALELCRHDAEALPRLTRIWAKPVYRLVYDPDRRPWRARLRGRW